MREVLAAAVSVLLSCTAALAQSPSPKPRFEVASIKPVVSATGTPFTLLGFHGGPGTSDRGRFTAYLVNLRMLIESAYGVGDLQLSGSLDRARWDIEAKIAPGATKEQLNLMLQSLLEDRFNLKSHREARDVDGYDLVVAKGGSKLKAAKAPPPASVLKLVDDEDGFPNIPGTELQMKQGTRIELLGASMQTLVTYLQRKLVEPVRDKTGLTDTYNFKLTFGNVNTDNPAYEGIRPPDFLAALQQQLGLKLEPAKIPTDMLVIDHVDSTPSEN